MRSVHGQRKRLCCGNEEHKVYPRVDPVVRLCDSAPQVACYWKCTTVWELLERLHAQQ